MERRCPLWGKSVTFPVCWWQFHSLLMTDCDTLKCLATFCWILPFCSIPMAIQLSFFVKCCKTALEDRHSVNLGLWIPWVLKQKSCEHCSNYVYLVRNLQQLYPFLRLDKLYEVSLDYFVLKLSLEVTWLTEHCLVLCWFVVWCH